MNFNKYSVLLTTLKLKGPLTRPNLWNLVKDTQLFSGATHMKCKMDILLGQDRITKKCITKTDKKGKLIQDKFVYSFAEHERNVLPEPLVERIKSIIDVDVKTNN
ncbi:hypothetical protein CYY_009479 [Polysphondylium violaceum]|uniref:Uncharacterized protein n=1 Tax=Polysphondylium violaceum TaxID=133409 RepID=A0A8J4PK07_9MYCE|nr:hypothetical protein CYY_009479 [Polysphondylium violaceum]